jgi:gamma-glutamyltranspeptidase/glutathione hydrolase
MTEESFSPTKDGKFTESDSGMVVTAFPAATQAGITMFKLGGNAVDAACAAALALGVCEPQGSGIGGQTVAILHINGQTIAIDGSTKAPSLAHSSQYKTDTERKRGYKAMTIPSTPAVLGYMNEKYGRLKWKTVVQPALKIASSGYQVTELQSSLLRRELENFLKVPNQSGALYMLKDGKEPYEPGELFIQYDLAGTLAEIASQGYQAMYSGKIAAHIDSDMRKHGGLLRLEDLALIPEVIERVPVEGGYRGYAIKSLPPPGSGETLLLILAMMEKLSPEMLRENSPGKYKWMAEILHKAFLDYRSNPRNPNTFGQIPEGEKDIHHRASQLIGEIKSGERLLGRDNGAEQGMGETTHLSVMDKEGNVVGITQSLNLVYGAKVATKGLGFLYNNYIEAFQFGKPGHYYNLRPGGIPWPCATPTIVFKNNMPWIVLGSPGSQRIFSSIAQFLSLIIDRNMSMDKAIEFPRIHSEQNGELSMELERMHPAIVEFLKNKGYKIKKREAYSFYMGAIHAALLCQSKNGFQGAADVRRDGTAMGNYCE